MPVSRWWLAIAASTASASNPGMSSAAAPRAAISRRIRATSRVTGSADFTSGVTTR
jgi:hypothetical protein